MTEILKIAGIAVISVLLVIIVREYKKEMAFQISIAAICILMLLIIGTLTDVLDSIKNILGQYGFDSGLFGTILKIIGIAYMAQLAAQICIDAGESALAVKVELAGRILLIATALPLCISILEAVSALLKEAAV